MNVTSRLIGGLVLPLSIAFSTPILAQPADLGNITDSSATYSNFVATNILGLIVVNPEDIKFSFSNTSDLDIDLTSFLNADIGGYFELSKIGGGFSTTFAPPLLNLAGTYSQSFSDLLAGDYQFKYVPSLLSLGLSTNITFTATTVPEPASAVLMFAGLGLALLGATRKKSS